MASRSTLRTKSVRRKHAAKPRSLPRTARTAKNITTGDVQPKKARSVASTDSQKQDLQYLKDLMTLEEAQALVKTLEGQHRDTLFGEERRRHAEFEAAREVVFAKDRCLPSIIAKALVTDWSGPERMREGGYYQLGTELELAIDALSRIEPAVEWQKEQLHNVTWVLRGIQHRMKAIRCFGHMFEEKSS
jgi:hypothetical protein